MCTRERLFNPLQSKAAGKPCMLPRRTSRSAELLRCRILLCEKKDDSFACMFARGIAITVHACLSACLHAAFLYSTALLQILYACSLDLCPAALGFVSVTCVDKNRPQQSGTAGLVQADGCFSQLPSAMQHLIIYTFKRSRRKRCEWKPCRIVLKSQVRLARLQQVHRVSKALYRTDCFRGAASVLSLTQTFESLHIQSGRGQGLLQSCLRFLCAVMQSLQRQLSALAPIHRRLRPCLKV